MDIDMFDYLDEVELNENPPPKSKIFLWKTRTGQMIPISEMSDSHLKNSINLLRREIFSFDPFKKVRQWKTMQILKKELFKRKEKK